MKTLVLPVKKRWFDAIARGDKVFEYRLASRYWRTRLVNKHYDRIVITLGYPSKSDASRRLEFDWHGCVLVTGFVHEEWGNKPVDVFAIALQTDAKEVNQLSYLGENHEIHV